jgi:hypothetical protein
MMADEHNVSIVAWPKEPAALAHRFDAEEPISASISFADTPARVIVSTEPSQPVAVDMSMHVTAREPIPLCIKLCEPICAKSDYTIGINIFDNPFASITVRGMTRLFNCRDEQPEPKPQPELVCVRFDHLQPNSTLPQPVALDGLTLSPLGGTLRVVTFGEPAGRIKLGFEPAGIRIDFPAPVQDVRLMLNNYGQPELEVTAYSGTSVLAQFTAHIANTVREVPISQPGITAVTVSGGTREAALVQVCYLR